MPSDPVTGCNNFDSFCNFLFAQRNAESDGCRLIHSILYSRVDNLREDQLIKGVFSFNFVLENLADDDNPIIEFDFNFETVGISCEVRSDFINRAEQLLFHPLRGKYHASVVLVLLLRETDTQCIAGYLGSEFCNLRHQQIVCNLFDQV